MKTDLFQKPAAFEAGWSVSITISETPFARGRIGLVATTMRSALKPFEM